MKRLMKKLEDIVVAVTFAEAGEYETAMEVLGQKSGEEEVVTEPITDPEIV